MSEDRSERPNHVPWPPLLLGGSALAAVSCDVLAVLPEELHLPHHTLLRGMGLVLGVAGGAFIVWAIGLMMQTRSNILPNQAATRLLKTGPFGWSRNPIYFGEVIVFAGIALFTTNPVYLIAGLLLALSVHHLGIRREEAHMAARFGSDWSAYCARVPRWFGPF
ncbi:MAG: isoprenylcysteine carboxylmethyltransferase family protein [Pseudomonadota bacterium]